MFRRARSGGQALRAGDEQAQTPGGELAQYNREALEARVQGLFIARCRLTVQGTTEDCCIDHPLPHLEWTVLHTLSRLRFEPVLDEGEPIDVEYVFHLRFSLPR